MILSRIREQTATLHQKIEQTVNLSQRLQSRDSYAELLCRFYGFYAPLEARLIEISDFTAARLDLRSRLKSSLLREDLLALGWTHSDLAAVPLCTQLPDIPNLAAALGCLYVVEGATLGGQIVRKQVKQLFDLQPGTGCSFFSSYGHRVGEMWTDFCSALTAYAEQHPDENDQIVSSAAETFARFEEWVAC